MGELVGIDELLVGRPLLLELFERGGVDDGAPPAEIDGCASAYRPFSRAYKVILASSVR
jgi:hypothetical protein